MKAYMAGKPCSFGGKRYMIGDTIPTEYIDPDRVNALTKYGTIRSVDVPDPEPEQATETEQPENTEQATETEKPVEGAKKNQQRKAK